MLSALVGVPMVAHCATPEQAAAERLKSAFECAYITDVHYEIPQTDDAAQEDAVTLYRYVRRHRALPSGVSAGSEPGNLLKPLLKSQVTEKAFTERVQEELRTSRLYKLDELCEQNSYFAEGEFPLTLYGDEDSVIITFDPTEVNEPDVEIVRSQPVNSKPWQITLCYSGRVAHEGDTRATLLLQPYYSLVVINRAEDRFTPELARHFGRHCHVVTYMGNFEKETPDVLEMKYTPDGSTDDIQRGVRDIPVYIRLAD